MRYFRYLFATTLFGICLSAQVSSERLDAQARAYYELDRFNGAVIVAKDGVPILEKGYGMANFEWNAANTADTKFRLGSITKQFTGMCILLLEQDGKLKTSDLVSKYVDGTPASWANITIHQLLTHTSGIFSFTGLPDYSSIMGRPSPPLESLKRVYDKPLEFDPGTKYKYSNSGYIMLGAIIEKVSGMTYEEFLRTRVLIPLGMKDTGYDWDYQVVQKRAAGYERDAKGLRNAAFIHMTVPHAAGALYSTARDMIKWDAALREGKLLTPESYKRYYTPEKDGYAYGWAIGKLDEIETIGHNGGINGFSTSFIRVPSQKLAVIVLCNVEPGRSGNLARDLARLALGKDVAVPVKRARIELPVSALQEYVGKYVFSPQFAIVFTVEDGQLVSQATGQGKLPVVAEAKDRFYPTVVEATLVFERGADGKLTGLRLQQGGRDMPAKRE